MKTYFWVAIALCALVRASAYPAEVLVNGNIEEFQDGVPAGWNMSYLGFVNSLESTVHTSPFTLAYPTSTKSVFFGEGAELLDGITYIFPRFTGQYSLRFDFRLASSPPTRTPWLVMPFGQSNPEFYLSIGNGQFGVSSGETFGGTDPLTTLQNDVWYHVAVDSNPDAFTYSGMILPFGGTPVAWNARPMHRYDGFTGILNVFYSGSNDTPIYFDNFSIVPIPEPSILCFFGLTACSFVLRYRKSFILKR